MQEHFYALKFKCGHGPILNKQKKMWTLSIWLSHPTPPPPKKKKKTLLPKKKKGRGGGE